MVNSGIKVTADAIKVYANIQGGAKEYRYVVMGFSDDKTCVEVKDKGTRDQTFQDMMAALPKDKVRFIFFNLSYKTTEGQDRDRLLLAVWSSDDDADAKEKMLVSSTLKEVEKKCTGFYKKVSYHDWSELTEETFIEDISQGRKK